MYILNLFNITFSNIFLIYVKFSNSSQHDLANDADEQRWRFHGFRHAPVGNDDVTKQHEYVTNTTSRIKFNLGLFFIRAYFDRLFLFSEFFAA